MEVEDKMLSGDFVQSLKRNNKQIKDDRALALGEDVEMAYKRTVEDLSIKLKRLLRERAGMLDLSPTTAQSLVLVNDFDAQEFVDKELEISVNLRNTAIKHNVAVLRYNKLFNGHLSPVEVEEA